MKINRSSNKQAGYSDDGALAVLIIIALIVIVCLAAGHYDGIKDHQRECVKVGVAHYEPNEKGESVFKFNVTTNK